MYSAHYDHLGIRPDMPGDNIYNGADDNATGCGILLEMARAYAMAAQRPRRSILFASVTAEEQGLLGSEYLGKHPPDSRRKDRSRFEFDDIPPLGAPEEVEVSGSGAHHFLSHGGALAQEFRSGDSSRLASRGGTLLSLRSFQPGARGHSRVLHQ